LSRKIRRSKTSADLRRHRKDLRPTVGAPDAHDSTAPVVGITEVVVPPGRGGKLTPPDKYAGESDPKRCDSWLQVVEAHLYHSGISPAAMSMLTGAAAQHFPDRARGIPFRTMTWDHFCTLLLSAYARNDLKPRARAQLDNLRQTVCDRVQTSVLRADCLHHLAAPV
jgi:hypothetical protein